MTVVDSHVHLLPGRLGAKVRGLFDTAGLDLAYPNDHDEVARRLAADGVDAVWALPYAHKPGVARGLNESQAEVAASVEHVEVVLGCTVHPDDDDPAAIVRDAVADLGARVVKLHCSVGHFDADDPGLDVVWELVAELRLPVVLHAGHAVSGLTVGEELAPVARVATRYPDVRLIIAHCAQPAVDAALDLVEAHPNVYADLTPVLMAAVEIPARRRATVAHRLLHGSDAPNAGHESGALLERIRGWSLPEEAIAAITGGTAMRLTADVDAP